MSISMNWSIIGVVDYINYYASTSPFEPGDIKPKAVLEGHVRSYSDLTIPYGKNYVRIGTVLNGVETVSDIYHVISGVDWDPKIFEYTKVEYSFDAPIYSTDWVDIPISYNNKTSEKNKLNQSLLSSTPSIVDKAAYFKRSEHMNLEQDNSSIVLKDAGNINLFFVLKCDETNSTIFDVSSNNMSTMKIEVIDNHYVMSLLDYNSQEIISIISVSQISQDQDIVRFNIDNVDKSISIYINEVLDNKVILPPGFLSMIENSSIKIGGSGSFYIYDLIISNDFNNEKYISQVHSYLANKNNLQAKLPITHNYKKFRAVYDFDFIHSNIIYDSNNQCVSSSFMFNGVVPDKINYYRSEDDFDVNNLPDPLDVEVISNTITDESVNINKSSSYVMIGSVKDSVEFFSKKVKLSTGVAWTPKLLVKNPVIWISSDNVELESNNKVSAMYANIGENTFTQTGVENMPVLITNNDGIKTIRFNGITDYMKSETSLDMSKSAKSFWSFYLIKVDSSLIEAGSILSIITGSDVRYSNRISANFELINQYKLSAESVSDSQSVPNVPVDTYIMVYTATDYVNKKVTMIINNTTPIMMDITQELTQTSNTNADSHILGATSLIDGRLKFELVELVASSNDTLTYTDIEYLFAWAAYKYNLVSLLSLTNTFKYKKPIINLLHVSSIWDNDVDGVKLSWGYNG